MTVKQKVADLSPESNCTLLAVVGLVVPGEGTLGKD